LVAKLGLIPALAQSTSALIRMRAFFALFDLSWIEYRMRLESNGAGINLDGANARASQL
jgi:hypothetical protein